MADLRITVAGCTGRMGLALLHELARPKTDTASGLSLSGALVRGGHEAVGKPVSDLVSAIEDGVFVSDNTALAFDAADVVIDFTSPETVAAHAELARSTGTALLVGTTGLGATEIDTLEAASASAPILIAPNTSLCLNLMLRFVRDAAARLGPEFSVSIDDLHHAGKKDAPSGTALALSRAAGSDRAPEDISITSRREGDTAGTHTVTFEGPQETLQLVHSAKDRAIFAKGALVAARWLARQQPGLYTMADVLGIDPGHTPDCTGP